MGTVPTGMLERRLRQTYLQWLGGLSTEADVAAAIRTFEKRSRAVIAKEGGHAASLGALADFPVPKLLELSPRAGTIYDEMQQAGIRASIAAGLNSRDAARQILNAGLGKSYRQLERLARTETVSAYWKNQWDSVADLPDIVMLWGSEESKKTCDFCLSRDGLVVEDSNIRDHPNGRCTLVPTLRQNVKYKGTLQPDGSVTMDSKWTQKPVTVKPPVVKATPEQLDPLSPKKNPAAPSVAQPVHQTTTVKAVTNADKINNAEIMFGTGSKQHLAAIKKFSTPNPLKAPTLQPVPPLQPRVIKSVKDMEDFGKSMPVPSQLSTKAAQAMDDYAKGTAYTANAVLRGQKTYLGRAIDARTKAYTKKFTKEVDNMMDASLVPEDVRVVRTVSPEAFGGLDKLRGLQGGVYEDKGYMSTSLAEKVNGKIYDVKDGIEMEIEVPKGTRALYMAGESYLKNERELLLDRGTKMAVQSVEYDEKRKKWKVKATVIPGPR
jgi:hypothetical protein